LPSTTWPVCGFFRRWARLQELARGDLRRAADADELPFDVLDPGLVAQEIAAVPTVPSDVRLDFVLTESEAIDCGAA